MFRFIALSFLILVPVNGYSFFGTEIAPLLQLVSGQVQQIKQLADQVGVAKEQQELLIRLNEGIGQVVDQIQTLQTIVERAKGLDPREVKSLSDLNDLLARAKQTQAMLLEMQAARVNLANQAIAQGSLQSDTAYKMGQEMVGVGSRLAVESETASPGRAHQITAAASSAQMLSQGVQLQTLSQLVQLQALSLEFQKAEAEKELQGEQLRRNQFQRGLKLQTQRGRP